EEARLHLQTPLVVRVGESSHFSPSLQKITQSVEDLLGDSARGDVRIRSVHVASRMEVVIAVGVDHRTSYRIASSSLKFLVQICKKHQCFHRDRFGLTSRSRSASIRR